MTTLESESAVAMRVQVTDEAVFVELQDGRTVTAPLSWYPRLSHGTPAERGIWELVGRSSILDTILLFKSVSREDETTSLERPSISGKRP